MTGAILSEHYNASDPATPKTIKPEEHRSMQREFKPSPSSYPYGNSSLTMRNGSAYLRTANRLERFSLADVAEFGLPTSWDESAPRMDGWINAATNVKPADFDLVPTISQIANVRGLIYVTGTPVGIYLPHPTDTKMPRLKVSSTEVMAVDNNAVGLYEHRKLNLEQTMRILSPGGKYHFEAQEWVDFLGKKGLTFDKAGTPGVLATGILNDVAGEGFLYAYHTDLGYLLTEGAVHKRINEYVSELGVSGKDVAETVEAFKRADVMHELGHVLGIKGNRAHERLQGLLRNEFYTMMAGKYKNNGKLARIYKILAFEGLVYAELFSLRNALSESISAGLSPDKSGILEILRKKFSAEADAMELDGDLKKVYVRLRLDKSGVTEFFEGEPAYKQSGSSVKNGSPEETGGLERTIADKVSFDLGREGLVATLDGAVVGKDGANMPTHFVGKYMDRNEAVYEGKGHRSMADVEANLKNKKKAEPKESPDAASEAPAESASNN
ncbi:hypothetical protein HYY71_07145 [Candidatus Woesearchaeota archaeon]|nr:hypothetical protein [Candidatus Woesearchaeota archaeon]